jgi:GntR family transcriptional regulator
MPGRLLAADTREVRRLHLGNSTATVWVALTDGSTALATGDRLPKVKEVVASLAINPNTVLEAYRELDLKGLAAGRPGQGTFIEGTVEVVPLKDQQALKRGLVRWLSDATKAGLDEEGIAALVASALHDLRRDKDGKAS